MWSKRRPWYLLLVFVLVVLVLLTRRLFFPRARFCQSRERERPSRPRHTSEPCFQLAVRTAGKLACRPGALRHPSKREVSSVVLLPPSSLA